MLMHVVDWQWISPRRLRGCTASAEAGFRIWEDVYWNSSGGMIRLNSDSDSTITGVLLCRTQLEREFGMHATVRAEIPWMPSTEEERGLERGKVVVSAAGDGFAFAGFCCLH